MTRQYTLKDSPGLAYTQVGDCDCFEILEELIFRLETTNGLAFCLPARVNRAVVLLQGYDPNVPPMKEQPAYPPLIHIDLDADREDFEEEDSAEADRAYMQVTEERINALGMYNQLIRLAKRDGRW